MNKWILAVLIAVPQLAWASVPQGVKFEPRRGIFTEMNIGAFFTVGGADAYSNAQSYLQLGVGYDLGDRLEIGANFGLGANAANCFGNRVGQNCDQPANFTLMFLNGTLGWKFRMAERFFVTPKVSAGWATLDPAPVNDASGNPVRAGPNGGVGVGFEYVTAMDHFSVGAEVMGRYVLRANIPAIAVFPRIKYTF